MYDFYIKKRKETAQNTIYTPNSAHYLASLHQF